MPTAQVFLVSGNPGDPPNPAAHVLATDAGLGEYHTASGLTAGQVLRALSASTARFQVLVQSDITGLVSELAGKAASAHTHAEADVTNLVSDLAGKAASAHTHAAADVNSGVLAAARLASGTADTTTWLRGDQQWLTLPGLPPLVHGDLLHDATVASLDGGGRVPTAELGSGVASASTFLRGDQSWATPAGGAGSSFTAFTRDLGAARRSGTFDITGLSGLTADKQVTVLQTADIIASKGNARDEAEMDHISATGYVVNTTTIRCYWQAPSVVVGTYAFAYLVSA